MTKVKMHLKAAGLTQSSGNPAAVRLRKFYLKEKRIYKNLQVKDSSTPDSYAESAVENTAKDIASDSLNLISSKTVIRKKQCFTPRERHIHEKRCSEEIPYISSEIKKSASYGKHICTLSVKNSSLPPNDSKRYYLKDKSRVEDSSERKIPRRAKVRKYHSSDFSSSDSHSIAGITQLKKSFHIKSAVKANSSTVRLFRDSVTASKKVLINSAPFLLIIALFFILTAAFCMVFSSIYMSPYAVFYSVSEDSSIADIIREINGEFQSRIDAAVSAVQADEYRIEGCKAIWQDMLCIYAAHYLFSHSAETDTTDPGECLRRIFNDMNSLEAFYSSAEDTHEEAAASKSDSKSKSILTVRLSHLSMDDMAALYGFSDSEIKIMNELHSPKFLKMWTDIIYTSGIETDMVSVAVSQLGNIGGEPYWSWYGYTERVPWCAIFVSWCAYLCGYTDEGICPRFENCQAGVRWFIENGRFECSSYTPSRGDIIFFDWEGDGISDHVGIVESVTDDIICTIEGNSGDVCLENTYSLLSEKICGYGLMC